jgi:WD40 repeat protein
LDRGPTGHEQGVPLRAALAVPLLVVTTALVACTAGSDGRCADLADPGPGPARVAAAPAVAPPDPDVVLSAEDADLSRDGRRLVVACPDGACVWDPVSGRRLASDLERGTHLVWAGADDTVLASTGHDSGEELGEVLLSSAEGTCVMTGHDIPFATDGGSRTAALAADEGGSTLATGASDGRVGLWSVPERRRLAWLDPEHDTPSALAFDPTGTRLAVGGAGAPVEIWDVAERELVERLDRRLLEVAWSPDGSALAGVGDDGDLVVLDAATGRPTATLLADGARALVWSPDSARVAVVPPDEGLRVSSWTPSTGEVATLARHREPPRSAMWAPDGSAIYTVDSVEGVLRTPLDEWRPSGRPTVLGTPGPIRG